MHTKWLLRCSFCSRNECTFHFHMCVKLWDVTFKMNAIFFVERYKPLPYARAKLKFLDLQLELLDDYRIRLLQVKNQENNNPLGKIFTAIMNTVNCVVDALIGWTDMPVRYRSFLLLNNVTNSVSKILYLFLMNM